MSAPASIHSLPTVRPATTMSFLVNRLTATSNDAVLTIARVALAAVIFPHGAQKVLGWFGGYGLAGTMGFMTESLHIPVLFAVLGIVAEFAGSIALFLGLFGRVAAAGIAGVMVVAIATVHLANGFFMNWSGTQSGEGFEYHLLAIALAVVVMLRGSGKWSVDRAFRNRE